MPDSVSPQAPQKIIFSGIQPTGIFTLGNYIGAIKNWVQLQNDFRCLFSLVDLHAITVRQDPKTLRRNTLNSCALLLACGVDPGRAILFIQSHVPTHAELSWSLGCHTQFGELSRMTQFKDKSKKYAENINAGLFTYPVLMAADILLYQADLVPVGVDQKQHLELARNIAVRFNGLYGNTFTVPEPYIPSASEGAKIMSLSDPSKKMSKSDENANGFISILDDRDTIIRKCKRAVTDSESQVVYREGKAGINNLLTICSVVTGKSIPALEKEFEGKGYGEFKLAVGEAVADHLQPIREKFTEYAKDETALLAIYREGAQKAASISQRTLDKVYKKLGFLPRR